MAHWSTRQLVNELSHHWYKEDNGNVYKLIDVFASSIGQISETADKVIGWRDLDQAEGAVLDMFGKDIKTYRANDNDDDYRFMIRLKQLISRAQGTIPSIFKIVSTALNTKKDIKIWNAAYPRHVNVQIPLDACKSLEMQKFLLNNLQKMLAMGYWIDGIIFRVSTDLPLYIGGNAQSSWETTMRSKAIWWTGWKAKTEEKPFAGIIGRMSDTSIWKAKTTIWWSGWKAKTTPAYYVGMAERYISSSVWSTAIN